MKKMDLGQTIAILANVGVIAGIVFLAVEIRQNNEVLVAQTSYLQFAALRERRMTRLEHLDLQSDFAPAFREDLDRLLTR